MCAHWFRDFNVSSNIVSILAICRIVFAVDVIYCVFMNASTHLNAFFVLLSHFSIDKRAAKKTVSTATVPCLLLVKMSFIYWLQRSMINGRNEEKNNNQIQWNKRMHDIFFPFSSEFKRKKREELQAIRRILRLITKNAKESWLIVNLYDHEMGEQSHRKFNVDYGSTNVLLDWWAFVVISVLSTCYHCEEGEKSRSLS